MTSLKRIVMLMIALLTTSTVWAQDSGQAEPKKIEATYSKSFPTVWKCIRNAILEGNSCQLEYDKYSQNDKNLLRGKIQSVYCIIATGADSTKDVLEREGGEFVPFIRGASWVAARVQYTVNVVENPDKTVKIIVKGELSGYEDFITNRFHYFPSLGKLEEKLFADINRRVAEAKDE